MASKQLIACMSKAKGDSSKIAACKSSFAKKVPPKEKPKPKKKGFIRRAIEREFETGDSAMYAEHPELVPHKWRKSKKIKKKFKKVG